MLTIPSQSAPFQTPNSQLSAWTFSPDTISLYPTPSFTHRLNEYLSQLQQDDLLIRCVFSSSLREAKPVYIHRSRLEFAGGVLQSLITSPQELAVEDAPQHVQLSEKHDPDTFAVVRNFLYGMPIGVRDWTLSQVVKVVKVANEWQLNCVSMHIA